MTLASLFLSLEQAKKNIFRIVGDQVRIDPAAL
jgi:hypothetical protein